MGEKILKFYIFLFGKEKVIMLFKEFQRLEKKAEDRKLLKEIKKQNKLNSKIKVKQQPTEILNHN